MWLQLLARRCLRIPSLLLHDGVYASHHFFCTTVSTHPITSSARRCLRIPSLLLHDGVYASHHFFCTTVSTHPITSSARRCLRIPSLLLHAAADHLRGHHLCQLHLYNLLCQPRLPLPRCARRLFHNNWLRPLHNCLHLQHQRATPLHHCGQSLSPEIMVNHSNHLLTSACHQLSNTKPIQ